MEEALGVESLGHCEHLFADMSARHAVERVSLDFAVLHIVAHHIPQLLEEAHEVRLNHHAGGGVYASVGLVGELHAAVLLHSLYHHREVGAGAWHVFEHDALAHFACVAEHTGHRGGVDEELAQLPGLLVGVLNVILKSGWVAFYIYVENVGYSVAIVVESAPGERFTARDVGVHPQAVEVVAGDAAIALQGVDNPDVFVY